MRPLLTAVLLLACAEPEPPAPPHWVNIEVCRYLEDACPNRGGGNSGANELPNHHGAAACVLESVDPHAYEEWLELVDLRKNGGSIGELGEVE